MSDAHITIEVVTLDGGAIKITNTSESRAIVIDHLVVDGKHIFDALDGCTLVRGTTYIRERRGGQEFEGVIS